MLKNFVKTPNKRVLFDENDFRVLVNGGIVQKDGVEIALQDIGFNLMEQLIDEARDGSGSRPTIIDDFGGGLFNEF